MSEAAASTKKTFGEMVVNYFREFGVLKETRAEYWGIQVVNFLDCTYYFAMIAISTLFLSKELGMNDINAGYSVTIFSMTITISLIFAGMITDWLGIKRSLYIAFGGMLIFRLLMVGVGLFDQLPYRAILGIALLVLMAPLMAMIQTVFQAANARFTTERSRSAGFSLWYLVMNLGAAAAGFSVDIIRLDLGLSNTHFFTMGAILGVLCVIATFFFIRREGQLTLESEVSKGQKTDAKKEMAEKKIEKKTPIQILKELVRESAFWKLLVLIGLLIGARAVFLYMYMLMPKYWLRTIGESAPIGLFNTINPIGIIVGIILFIPLVNKVNIFSALIYGSIVSIASLFVLVIPWQWFSSDLAAGITMMTISSQVLLTIGEVIWSPKLSEYTAAIAPPGQEGTYLGFSMIPWFLAKAIVGALSGHLLTRWCPEGIHDKMASGQLSFWDSPAAMWLVLGGFALAGSVIALILRGWLTKGARFASTPATVH